VNDAQKRAYASEFRFVYWSTDRDYRCYTVRRGHGRLDGRWAIWDGGAYTWDGTQWTTGLYGENAYRWDLDEALRLGDLLAREMNAVVIHRQEKRFPGQFKGGPYDMAARRDEE
jgi:hypothetical protein